MRTSILPLLLLLLLCAALTAAPGVARAQLGDPDSFSDDPAVLAHLGFEDFDDPSLDAFWFASAWERDGVVYAGEGLVTAARCVPGMDSASFDGDPTTECGGENRYLAHDTERTLAPRFAADQVGFFYGTRGEELWIDVWLSDGSVRGFVMMGGAPEGGTGTAGYFAYGTGSPQLRIERVLVRSAPGGVDEVSFGTASSQDFAAVALDELEATCSVTGLAEAIAQTPMTNALGDDLDARMAQILDWWDARDALRVARGLELVLFRLELGLGSGAIDAADAEPLRACLEVLLASAR